MNVPNIISLSLTEIFQRNNLSVPTEFQNKIDDFLNRYNELLTQSQQYYLKAANPQKQIQKTQVEKKAEKIVKQVKEIKQQQLTLDTLKTQSYKALTDSKIKKLFDDLSPQQQKGRYGLDSTNLDIDNKQQQFNEINISLSPEPDHQFGPIMQPRQQFDPVEHFNVYNNFQIKAALHQIGKRYTTREAAIKVLVENYKQTGKLPNINLKQFQIMSPQTKNSLNDQIKNFIINSGWFTLVITHVPLDLDSLMKHLRNSGVSASKQYVEDYLVSEGVLIASKINDNDEEHVSIEPTIVSQISGIKEKDRFTQTKTKKKNSQKSDDGYKQLTITQMLKHQ